jgi:asparagine synthase (glutamine-hydrolysing)
VPVVIKSGSTLTVGAGSALSQIKIYSMKVTGANVPPLSCLDVPESVAGIATSDQIAGINSGRGVGESFAQRVRQRQRNCDAAFLQRGECGRQGSRGYVLLSGGTLTSVCGITGIVVHRGIVAPDLLERMTHSLAHRGPDDSGTVIVREESPEPVEVGLGNRRLAILDLSPLGHQPMQDSETGNWIVYNGEIYNFREVRSKLEGEGVRFRSQSDTEVLLKAYGRWGEGCLTEFRGMFAFAIWDAGRHRLFVARDAMGIKPLYYSTQGKYFLFASEVRTLLGTGLIQRRLDRSGLLNYLRFGSVYDPITLVEGVEALPAGHSLTWEKGNLSVSRYWDMGGEGGTHTPEKKDFEELNDVLDESVRLQMVSDVPVGVFLSGGIDSSALAGILSRDGGKLHTFSIVFREADYSEAKYSRLVAQKFGTEHQEILISQRDALEAIPGALQAMDQPTIDGLNTYLISRQTRAAGVKVAISGLGGDELFAGYSTFQSVPQMERFASFWKHIPHAARVPLAGVFEALAPSSDQNRKLAALARGNGNLLHPYFLSRELFTPEQRAALLSLNVGAFIERASAPLRDALARARGFDHINRVSYLEARCYMLNTLLRDSDVMSMAHGLEVRVPLIDHRLAEKLFRLPGSAKVDPSTPKSLLVNALHGELPSEIVHRRKRGFTLPFEHWLKDELRPEIESGLRGIAGGPLSGLFRAEAVQQVWDDFKRGSTSWSRPWSLYVLQQWCELQSVSA